MSDVATTAPVLRQTVKFGERYVSSALNRKFAGILDTGVYRGFVIKPVGEGSPHAVYVDNDDDYPRSVAVLERDGYSITVTMDKPGIVDIPAAGTWHIVIEAYYSESADVGYQIVAARDKLEDHHILLATVGVADMSAPITEEAIDVSGKADVQDSREAAVEKVDLRRARDVIDLSDRITKIELAQASGTAPAIYTAYDSEDGVVIRELDFVKD